MKRVLILTGLFVFLVVLTLIMTIRPWQNWLGEQEEEVADFSHWRELRWYTREMEFYGSGGDRLGEPVIPDRQEDTVDIALVHTEEMAANYPDDVSVLWPSDNTLDLVMLINLWIRQENVYMGQFSLEYPLTIDNAVNDWEKVYEFWRHYVPEFDRLHLRGHARNRSNIIICTCFVWRAEGERERNRHLLKRMNFGAAFDFIISENLSDISVASNVKYALMINYHDTEAENYTDIVFVSSPEEAAGFDDTVLVAWPSDRTWAILEAFNRRIHDLIIEPRDDLYPPAWSSDERNVPEEMPETLSYPITMEDIVENWEGVWDFYISIPSWARDSLDRDARALLREAGIPYRH